VAAAVLTIGTLRPALELAWAVAKAGTQARPPISPPGRLRPLMRFAKLPDRALATVQQVVEDDPAFRARVVEWADEAKLDRQAWLWLVRPDGWEHDLEIGVVEDRVGVSKVEQRKEQRREDAGAGEPHAATAEGAPSGAELARLQQANAELEDRLAAEQEARRQAEADRESAQVSTRQAREAEERETAKRLAAAEQSGARAEAELVRLHQANAELTAQLTSQRDVRRQAEADRDAHEVARRQATVDREASEVARRQAMADREASEVARRGAEEERIRLEEAVTVLEGRVSSLGTDRDETVEQLTDTEGEHSTAGDQLALLTDQLQQARAEASRLRADRDAIEVARRQAIADHEATQVARRTVEEQLGRLEGTVMALEGRVSSLGADRDEGVKQLTQASQERETLRDQVALLTTELKEAQDQTAQLQADRDVQEVARQEAQDEREGFEASRRQAEQEHESLEADRGQLEQAREALEADRQTAIEARESLEADRGQLEQAREALEADRGQLEQARESLEADRGQLEQAREALEALEADRRAAIEARESLEAERESLEADRRATAEEREAVDADRHQAEEERESLEADRQTATADRSGLEEALAVLQSRVAELESDLEDATEQLARSSLEQDTAREEIAELIDQLRLARAETTRLHVGREEIRAAAGREIARAAEAARLLSEALAEAALTRSGDVEEPIQELGVGERQFGRERFSGGGRLGTGKAGAGDAGAGQEARPITAATPGAERSGGRERSRGNDRLRSGEWLPAAEPPMRGQDVVGAEAVLRAERTQGPDGFLAGDDEIGPDETLASTPRRRDSSPKRREDLPAYDRVPEGVRTLDSEARRRSGPPPSGEGRAGAERPVERPPSRGRAGDVEAPGLSSAESPSPRSPSEESESADYGAVAAASERKPTGDHLAAADDVPDGELLPAEAPPSSGEPALGRDRKADGDEVGKGELDQTAPEAAAAKPAVATPPSRPRPGTIRRRPLPLPPAIFDDSVEAAAHLVRVPSILLIVDGYNVTMTSWPHLELSRQRHQLVDALAELAVRLGTLVQVVFDGADMAGRFGPPPNARRLMRVTFSPDGVEADEIIVDIVDHLDPTQAVVVATNDRQLQDAVRRRGGNVITVAQLLAVVGRTGTVSSSSGLRWRNRQRKGPAAK
jgi:predicted RNA-binding protein with PIN domain